MGPLAELLILNYFIESPDYEGAKLFFRHYLIARQLHDDAHDWADDLSHGQINSIGALVLNYFKEHYPKEENATAAILTPKLREIFWTQILDVSANMITATSQRHARQENNRLFLPAQILWKATSKRSSLPRDAR